MTSRHLYSASTLLSCVPGVCLVCASAVRNSRNCTTQRKVLIFLRLFSWPTTFASLHEAGRALISIAGGRLRGCFQAIVSQLSNRRQSQLASSTECDLWVWMLRRDCFAWRSYLYIQRAEHLPALFAP
jgi:hypothetical protein